MSVKEEGQVLEGTAKRVFSKSLGSPEALSADGCHAALALTTEVQTITTDITNPDVPRNVTVVATEAQADDVVVTGTDENGVAVEETLTLDGATPVLGLKAFATVTQIVYPIKDDGASVSVGYGDVLGLGLLLSRDSIVHAYFNGVLETTRPAVVFSSTVVASNTALLNSAMDGSAVIIDYYES
ncbi:hypothetical protein ES708_06115 [subsurface metagenome]